MDQLVDPPNGAESGDYVERWANFKPKFLIVRTHDFVVGIDHELDVDWQTSPEYDAKGQKNEVSHNAVMGEAAELEVMPCHGFTEPMQIHFKRLIGEAIWKSLEHDYKNAKICLGAARTYVQA